jgi:hypothetical protein
MKWGWGNNFMSKRNIFFLFIALALVFICIQILRLYSGEDPCDALSRQLNQVDQMTERDKSIQVEKQTVPSNYSNIENEGFDVTSEYVKFSIPHKNPIGSDPLDTGTSSVFTWGEEENHRVIVFEPRDFRVVVEGLFGMVKSEVDDRQQCGKVWEELSDLNDRQTDKELFFTFTNHEFEKSLSPLSTFALRNIRLIIFEGRKVLIDDSGELTFVRITKSNDKTGQLYVFDQRGLQVLTLLYSNITLDEQLSLINSIRLK